MTDEQIIRGLESCISPECADCPYDGDELIIPRLRGEDGHTVFSIRVPKQMKDRILAVAFATDRSCNSVINLLLDFALDRCKFGDLEEENEV